MFNKESNFKLIFLFFIIILVFSLSSEKSIAGLISTEQEIQLGREAAAQLEAEYGVYKDPAMTAWVAKVGNKLARISPREGITYIFKIINMEEPNALAIPGGYVYVTKGILRDFVKKDESYLAVILGHEIGHVDERHGTTQLEWSTGLSAVLQVLLGGNQTAYNIAQLASEVIFLKYSRDQERDADKYGMRLAYKTGYDPRALIRFFKDLKKYEGQNKDYTPEFLASHPDTDERIEEAEKYLVELQGGYADVSPTPTPHETASYTFNGDLSGEWETNLIGNLTIIQDGDEVNGTYQNGKGVIAGTIDGNKLNYEWQNYTTGKYGMGYFVISEDGDNMEGEWYQSNGKSKHITASKRGFSQTVNYPTPVNDSEFDVSGTWKSSIGELSLVQKGNEVEGYYGKGKGRIKGKVKDNRFDYEWYETVDNEGGTGYFIISKDGKSMEGEWVSENGTSGKWKAKR